MISYFPRNLFSIFYSFDDIEEDLQVLHGAFHIASAQAGLASLPDFKNDIITWRNNSALLIRKPAFLHYLRRFRGILSALWSIAGHHKMISSLGNVRAQSLHLDRWLRRVSALKSLPPTAIYRFRYACEGIISAVLMIFQIAPLLRRRWYKCKREFIFLYTINHLAHFFIMRIHYQISRPI